MPLDVDLQQYLQQLPESSGVLSTEAIHMLRKVSPHMANVSLPEVGTVENRIILSETGDIPVRIYTPIGDGPFPVLMYFHGGGWTIGSVDTYDILCRHLTRITRRKVVSVDYRLAPEHPFPAAPNDCYTATEWVYQNADALKIQRDQLGVAGDSAGANLATVVTLMAKQKNGPQITHQVLLYPSVDLRISPDSNVRYSSLLENRNGPILTEPLMKQFRDCYITSDDDANNPYASPILFDKLEWLPQALVITATFDPLRDEGELYAKRLAEAGVTVEVKRYEGACHGFILFPIAATNDALTRTAKFLQRDAEVVS